MMYPSFLDHSATIAPSSHFIPGATLPIEMSSPPTQTEKVVGESHTVSSEAHWPPVGGVGEGSGGAEEEGGAGAVESVVVGVGEGVGAEVGTGSGSVGGEGGSGLFPSGAPGTVPEQSNPLPFDSSPNSTSSPG